MCVCLCVYEREREREREREWEHTTSFNLPPSLALYIIYFFFVFPFRLYSFFTSFRLYFFTSSSSAFFLHSMPFPPIFTISISHSSFVFSTESLRLLGLSSVNLCTFSFYSFFVAKSDISRFFFSVFAFPKNILVAEPGVVPPCLPHQRIISCWDSKWKCELDENGKKEAENEINVKTSLYQSFIPKQTETKGRWLIPFNWNSIINISRERIHHIYLSLYLYLSLPNYLHFLSFSLVYLLFFLSIEYLIFLSTSSYLSLSPFLFC